MVAVLELGSDLNQVVVVELDFSLALVPGPDVDGAVGEAEVVGAAPVEVAADPEGLQDEGPLEPSADVHDRVFRQQLHSDKYR